MSRTYLRLLIFTIFSLFMGSCLEEIGELDMVGTTTLRPKVQLPVAYGDFNFEDLISSTMAPVFVLDEGGFYTLVYQKQLSTSRGRTLYPIPAQNTFSQTFTGDDFPGAGSIGDSETQSNDARTVFNAPGSSLLDSILISDGYLRVSIDSDFSAAITLTVRLPEVVDAQGNEASGTWEFDFEDSGGTWMVRDSINLSGLMADLSDDGNSSNSLLYEVQATVTNQGQPILNTNTIDVNLQLSNIRFGVLFGELDEIPFDFPVDDLPINLFSFVESGVLQIENPSLVFDHVSTLGMRVRTNLSQVSGNGNSGITPLTGAVTGDHIIPATPFGIPGLSIQEVITADKDNSNIEAIVADAPEEILYRFNGMINPQPAPAGQKQFVTDTSRLDVSYRLELPLSGIATELSYSKSFDFDGIGIDELEDLAIRTVARNRFPLEVTMQVYFEDNGTVLDSLFILGEKVIEEAPADANGFSTAQVTTISETPISDEKLDRISQTNQIRVRFTLNTFNNQQQFVKIKSEDRLELEIGITGRIRFDL